MQTKTRQIQEWEALAMFDEALNELYEPIMLMGNEYLTAEIIKNCDPIKYRCEFADFVDALMADGYDVEGWN